MSTPRLPVHGLDPAGVADGDYLLRVEAGAVVGLEPASASAPADPEVIRDTIAAALREGANVTITVDDAGDTITIAAKPGSLVLDSGASVPESTPVKTLIYRKG